MLCRSGLLKRNKIQAENLFNSETFNGNNLVSLRSSYNGLGGGYHIPEDRAEPISCLRN